MVLARAVQPPHPEPRFLADHPPEHSHVSSVSTLVGALIIGLVIGTIARLFVPDRRPGTLAATITLAVIGAVGAVLLGPALGWNQSGLAPRFVIALLGALSTSTGYRLISDEIARIHGVAAAHSGRARGAP